MPYTNDFRVMLVNKKHFADAGITEMPKTLDELVADAKTIKEKGIAEYPIGLPLSPTEGASTSWYLLTKAFGGDLFDKDFKPLFADAGFGRLQGAWPSRQMLLKDGLVDPASTGLKDSQINDSMFAKGLTSIMISGEPGRLGQMNDPAQSQVAGQVEAILVPTVSGKTRSYGLLEALAVPKVSQHKEAAIEFIKWFTSKEFQIENYANGVLPTRTRRLPTLNEAGQADQRRCAGRRVQVCRAAVPAGHADLVSAVLERGEHRDQQRRQGSRSRSIRRCRTSPTPRKQAMAQ